MYIIVMPCVSNPETLRVTFDTTLGCTGRTAFSFTINQRHVAPKLGARLPCDDITARQSVSDARNGKKILAL